MKIYDDHMSLSGRSFSRTELRDSGGWIDGAVVTPWGIVLVYAQGDAVHVNNSRLDFAHNGRLHIRNFKGKRYTQRGLARVAAKFAREIVESKP